MLARNSEESRFDITDVEGMVILAEKYADFVHTQLLEKMKIALDGDCTEKTYWRMYELLKKS